jgi:hypothetical protein
MKNQNTNDEDYYQLAKRQAKEEYGKIKSVWSPALGDEIAFNNKGFKHLVGDGRRPRQKNDRMRRFALLPLASEIIASAKIYEDHRRVGQTQYWAVAQENNGEIVRVVIRQIGSGRKHFFSIYNQKTAP